MKRFAYYIACCSLVALFSCTHDDVYEDLTPVGDGRITIQSTLDDMAITRAAEGEVDDTNPERTITHIDVFAIDKDGNVAYYERNTTGNNNGAAEDGAGTLKLQVARRAKKADDSFYFAQDESYRFILVANATASSEYMATLTTLADLENAVQDDSFETSFVGGGSTNDGETGSGTDSTTGGATEGTPTMSRQTLLHLTGTQQGENPDVETPQVFLMDAVATDNNGNQEWVVNPASGSVDNLDLEAEFKRAASKIVVNITQGEDVEFRTQLGTESTQYDFYKLPASTFVLPNESKLVNIQLINTAPQQNNTETFVWTHTDASNETPRPQNSIKVIGYAYSHSWSDVDLANETSLILNIPMMWNKDNNTDTGYGYTENDIEHPNVENNGKEAEAPRSWYKVPLSQGKKFERNKCYIVNVTINAVGASTRSTAIELRDIEYVTLDWQDVGINVGDSSESPKYLILNTDLVEMYNVNFDNTSLSFSSSSAITSVTLKDVYKQNADGTFTSEPDSYYAYYINKFGNKLQLNADIRNTISATAEQNVLNGGISILSPILNTTDEERRLAIEALGETPTVPDKPDDTSKPNPTDYLGADYDYPIELPTASKYYENKTYTIYRYNEITGTFQSNTYKCSKSKNGNNFNWDTGDGWKNVDAPENYNEALNSWLASHPEYQEYLNAIAQYNAYQAALTAIQNSETSGETHYNTIRYLEFEVKNAEGLTATFRVMQYPVIYITNIQGWYSYRDDFGGTTYENKGTGVIQAKTYNQEDDTWTYDTDTSNGGFWNSKVAKNYDSSTGKSRIECYYWNGDSVESFFAQDSQNAKMYYVRVTASSSQYTIGRPRIVDGSGNITTDVEKGTTEASSANNKLVSPSFMIASRLGFIWSGTLKSKEMAVSHCKQYVEVHKDPATGKTVTYRDWRLPTTEEIKIIISLQGAENENDNTKAIDFLLNATAYYSAEGPVSTSTQQVIETSDASVRCIRDAYDNE